LKSPSEEVGEPNRKNQVNSRKLPKICGKTYFHKIHKIGDFVLDFGLGVHYNKNVGKERNFF
jgi:hypothetical protein